MALGKLPDDHDANGEAIVAEINITPLTDIFLVLLIIFMITSSAMIESGPKVDLPQAGVTASETKGVVVTVDKAQNIFINGQATDRAQLAAGLKSAVQASTAKRVVLEGDRGVALGDVVFVLDEARLAGAEEVAIAATKKQ